MKKPIIAGISISICLSLVIGAFLAPVTVYAWSVTGLQSTIASLILSLLLSSGSAPVNNAWLTQLNTAYGVESSIGTIGDAINSGLLTEVNGVLTDTGLSQAIAAESAYTDLGLAEIFTTTASDVGVAAGSGAANLASTAIEVGTVGTIGVFAGAVLAGVGAGIIANKVVNWAGNAIRAGVSYFQTPQIIADMGPGATYLEANYRSGQAVNKFVVPANCYGVYYIDNNPQSGLYGYASAQIVNLNNTAVTAKISTGSTWANQNIGNAGQGFYYAPTIGNMQNFKQFSNASDMNDYITALRNGTETPDTIKSPDIITPQGNAYGIIGEDGEDAIAGIDNQIPDGYTISPVDVQDYLNFADDARQNTEQGLTDQENNGQLFEDLIQDLINPYQQPEPEQPVAPSDPSHPVTPQQPIIPDKPDISNQDIQDSLNLATTPELKEVFPFCIPWDIVDCFLLFRVTTREAPYISWNMPDGNNITLDFSIFDSVAELLRMLELALFIVGLAVGTRYLIGAT